MVQETTSARGDPVGSANPARSKVEQRTYEGCPPECAGGPHETIGNGGPRWMVAERDAARRPGTEPGLQTSPSVKPVLTCENVISHRCSPQIVRKRNTLADSTTVDDQYEPPTNRRPRR